MKKNVFLAVALALLVLPLVHATAPVLSSVSVSGVSDSTANFAWTSNGTGYNNSVYYGTTSSLGLQVQNTTTSTSPRVYLTGLADETTYYYLVSSCDNASACTNSSQSTFETEPNCDSDNNALACDTLEGLPSAGTQLGGFMSNLAPGIGTFLLLLGIFGMISFVLYACIAGAIKHFSSGKK